MISLDRLPKHTFPQTSETCCERHNDPHCLCDVEVGLCVPVRFGSNVMFGPLALKAVGDQHVSARNIVDWAGIMLACYDTYRELDIPVVLRPEYDDDYNSQHDARGAGVIDKPLPGGRVDSPWTLMPKHVRNILLECCRQNFGWKHADVQAVIPAWLDKQQLAYVRKTYARRRWRLAKV